MWNCLNPEVAKQLRCYNQHIKYSYGNRDRDGEGETEEGRKAEREKERGEVGESSQVMPVELNAVS